MDTYFRLIISNSTSEYSIGVFADLEDAIKVLASENIDEIIFCEQLERPEGPLQNPLVFTIEEVYVTEEGYRKVRDVIQDTTRL